MPTYDLYAQRDERTVLANPHRGWYWHYIDCGYQRPRYRDDAALIGDPAAFPGLTMLYLRFDWVDVNPEKGVYDFSCLDSVMDEWGKKGYRFCMRMCPYQGIVRRWNSNGYATPAYVREAGAAGDFLEDRAWEPDYGDPIFMGYAAETLARLGEHYDGDPRLEYFDVGTFGTFGEGHTKRAVYSEAVLRRHIGMTKDAFPRTRVLVNDDMLRHNPDAKEGLIAYCLERGLGIRDDSICVPGPARSEPGYDTLREPKIFDRFRDSAPVDIEFAHAELAPADCWRSGFAAMEALRRTGATYAGFHDYPGRFLQNNPDFAEYAANRLGYWYRPDALTLGPDGSGRMTVTNLGWSKSYLPFSLRLRLVPEAGEPADLGCVGTSEGWLPQTETSWDFRTDLSGLAPGGYALQLGLFDIDGSPLRLAMKGYEDGYYTAGTFEVPEKP